MDLGWEMRTGRKDLKETDREGNRADGEKKSKQIKNRRKRVDEGDR